MQEVNCKQQSTNTFRKNTTVNPSLCLLTVENITWLSSNVSEHITFFFFAAYVSINKWWEKSSHSKQKKSVLSETYTQTHPSRDRYIRIIKYMVPHVTELGRANSCCWKYCLSQEGQFYMSCITGGSVILIMFSRAESFQTDTNTIFF